MRVQVEGFIFSDFCLRCQKVKEHQIVVDGKDIFGVCSTCKESRVMTDVKQAYYSNTDLWVTRFKIGNLPSVVAGKLLDTVKQIKT